LDHRPPEAIGGRIYGVPHPDILKREGLLKPPDMKLLAGKEYQRKTSGPHQMWATDSSYFRVAGWEHYYMITVMDDYSRSILAWKL